VSSQGKSICRTVLYIEDDADNVRLVGRILSRRPEVALLVAASGQEGLEMAARHQPDLVLLDFHLPDMDGEQILRRLRSQPRTAALRVVGLSGSGAATPPESLREMGVRRVLAKPYRVADLLAVIEGEHAGAEPSHERTPERDSQQVLDARQISQLRELDCRASGSMHSIVQIFLEGALEQIDEMSEAASKGDPLTAQRIAHNLKGSSGNLGAARFADLCAQVESLPPEATIEAVMELADRTREEFAALRTALLIEFPR
jgi:CheY-like chemotaxis protein/HPt (histidine-containing phosphotransfer) domain-containing protein